MSRRWPSLRTWPATRRGTTGSITPDDLKFHLVEAADVILPEVGPEMGVWTLEQLRKRGIDVKLDTRLESCVDGHVVLSDGTTFDAETVVWTAGVKASPVLQQDRPAAERAWPTPSRRDSAVVGTADAWGAGDGTAVPDLTTDDVRECAPNAQHAVRQSKVLADNLIACTPWVPAARVQAQVRRVGGRPRAAQGGRQRLRHQAQGPDRVVHAPHLPREPGADVQPQDRVVVDWTMALFFKREIVSLWSMHEPFRSSRRRPARPALRPSTGEKRHGRGGTLAVGGGTARHRDGPTLVEPARMA